MSGFGECGLCLAYPCTCNDPEPERETHGSDPVCPLCGAATIYGGDLRMEDGDEATVDCGRCEKPFVVRLVVSYDYYSRPIRAAEQKEKEGRR